MVAKAKLPRYVAPIEFLPENKFHFNLNTSKINPLMSVAIAASEVTLFPDLEEKRR